MSIRTMRTALAATLLCATTAAPAAAGTHTGPRPLANDPWRARAISSFAAAQRSAVERGATDMVWANLARTSARLEGWTSPTTTTLVRRALADKHPDGGFGVPRRFDAFGDGTVNPVGTGYTVTTADHVGQLLVEGYAAGHVSRYHVESVRDWLMRVPRTSTARGTCVAYSDAAADRTAARPDGSISRCVHNVNASAAMYLLQTARLGIERPGQVALARDMLRYTSGSLLPNGLWSYMTGRSDAQDLDHNSLNVEALHVADPGSPLTRRVVAAHFTAPTAHGFPDHLGRLRALVADPARCRAVFPEGTAFLAGLRQFASTPAGRATITTEYYSQAAVWDARSSELCRRRTP